ncbi:hypothetical protein SAMN06265375_103318 [Muriicola jejuensis]|uniref:Uncharacterized protein n=1 Tax=Muriicola jejuensis TaxID=504488 RepID=A0A6P0UM42_9FLAO|nr:hypothetical protein [Muriicola jejuensis]NER11326.1 hypothetical protein [Muriicola jejuensis]SMP21418.1 hypothetical protein SAMN06265375_103318 [Muriicola jejuensis]
MKIRIKGDSIRFRLTKSEVEALCNSGEYREETHFKSNSFTYAVKKSPTSGMSAGYADNSITLYVCDRLLEGWAENDTVGFEEVERIGDRSSLHLLLEKDFVCLDHRLEDQSDNYPNPKLQKEGLT